MTDMEVVRLAKDVTDGQLTATVPLLDRLTELGDGRTSKVKELLCGLHIEMAGQQERFARGKPDHYRTEEGWHASFSRARLAAWRNFLREFAFVFWPELLDAPLANTVVGIEAWLEPLVQIEKMRRPDKDDDDDMGAGADMAASQVGGGY